MMQWQEKVHARERSHVGSQKMPQQKYLFLVFLQNLPFFFTECRLRALPRVVIGTTFAECFVAFAGKQVESVVAGANA